MRFGIGKTETGKVRSNNEDSILVCNERIGLLPNVFAVADGMGGHNAGEVASISAIQFFCDYLKNNVIQYRFNQDLLFEAVNYANNEVFKLSLESEATSGMGTTFSACSWDDENLYYAHIGDSRIYRIAPKEILVITEDHSYVNELVKSGKLTPSEARLHPDRNVLTRVLGTENDAVADFGYLPLKDDDKILICSDGLTNMLTDGEIFQIVTSGDDDKKKVDDLIDLAIANGGMDNVSVILL